MLGRGALLARPLARLARPLCARMQPGVSLPRYAGTDMGAAEVDLSEERALGAPYFGENFHPLTKEIVESRPLSIDNLGKTLPIISNLKKFHNLQACPLCHVPQDDITYLVFRITVLPLQNPHLLNLFISPNGSLYKKNRTKHQRRMSCEVKKARQMGFLSYTNNLEKAEVANRYELAHKQKLTDKMRSLLEEFPIHQGISREATVNFAEKYNLTGIVHELDPQMRDSAYGRLQHAYNRFAIDVVKKIRQYYELKRDPSVDFVKLSAAVDHLDELLDKSLFAPISYSMEEEEGSETARDPDSDGSLGSMDVREKLQESKDSPVPVGPMSEPLDPLDSLEPTELAEPTNSYEQSDTLMPSPYQDLPDSR